jgi:hypothetical protein
MEGVGAGEDSKAHREHSIKLVDSENPNFPIQPTTDGAIIDSFYTLRVLIVLDMSCYCGNELEAKVPICIRSPDP